MSVLVFPDAGTKYQLTGSAKLLDLGSVSVKGWVRGVGFVRTSQAQGSLTFTNNRGSVTVALTSLKPADGFGSLPTWWHYQVTRGTGAYRHVTDTGTIRLGVTPGTTAAGTFGFAI